MRSNSNRFSKALMVNIIMLLFLSVSTGASAESTTQKAASNLLKSLTATDDPAVEPILNQWAIYLKSTSTHSIEDYTEALNALQDEYQDLLSQMEQCTTNARNIQEEYDPSWLKGLIEHFGLPYLKKNENSVNINIQLIMSGSYENCCGSVMEKLFFKETVLFGAYRYYMDLFSDFHQAQPRKVQQALKTRKGAADNFVQLINLASISKVLLGRGKPSPKLFEIEARNANEAIYNYFKENPPSCDIDGLKALRDFRKAIRESR